MKHIIILKYFIILYGVIKQNEQSCAVPSLNQTHTLVKLFKVTDAGTHLEVDTGIQVYRYNRTTTAYLSFCYHFRNHLKKEN